MLLAVRHNIPLILTDAGSGIHATLRSATYTNLPVYRRWQMHFTQTAGALHWFANILLLKLHQQSQNLLQWQQGLQKVEPLFEPLVQKAITKYQQLKVDVENTQNITKEQLITAEAVIAGYYWKGAALAVPEEYKMAGRHNRPAKDMVNAALNYWYGMLYHQVETAIHSCGLDASCSILHAEDYNTPALCFDLIEPFRPQADAAIVLLCQNRIIQPTHFDVKDNGYWLSKKGKQLIIPAYHAWVHEKMVFNNRNTLRKNHILQLPASLLKHIRSIYERGDINNI